MHLFDPEVNFACSGIIAQGCPPAVGAALAAKKRNTDHVAVAFLGEGALDQGGFLESLNLASVQNLPVVFVVEDNDWAISMPKERVSDIQDGSVRAEGHDMPGIRVDHDDATDVYDAAEEAVGRARDSNGPTLIEVQVHRRMGHFMGDPQTYRPDDADAEEGVVVNWFVSEGRVVEEGDSLCEIQVEKVSVDVLAPASGQLDKIAPGEDAEFVRTVERSPSGSDVSIVDGILRAVSESLDAHPEFNATFEDGVHRLYEDQHVGVDSFTPIIDPPEVAILGVSQLRERAVPADDGAEFRPFVRLDLTIDHRVVDGADAARFLETLDSRVQELTD